MENKKHLLVTPRVCWLCSMSFHSEFGGAETSMIIEAQESKPYHAITLALVFSLKKKKTKRTKPRSSVNVKSESNF